MIALYPQSWYWFIALPFLFILLLFGGYRGLSVLKNLGYRKGDPFLRRYILSRFTRGFSFLLFYVLIVLTLYDFHWGREPVRSDSKGIDMAVVMDLSYSMMARDTLPNRLEAGRQSILLLMQNLQEARYSLIPFKGEPLVAVPLTEDRVILERYLAMAEPDWLSSPGSNIEKALMAAAASLETEQDRNRVILLLSDGEELSGSALKAVRSLVNQNYTLIVLAGGGTDPYPVELSDGQWLLDQRGEEVRTAQNQELLKEMAKIMDGHYLALNDSGSQKELMSIMQSLNGPGLGIRYIQPQKYRLFLLPALILLLLHQILGRFSWQRK